MLWSYSLTEQKSVTVTVLFQLYEDQVIDAHFLAFPRT